MAPEVEKKPAAIVADNDTGDVFHIVLVVTGKELDPPFAFPYGEPFLEMVGAKRCVEIVPFLCGVRGFLAIDDETTEGGDPMHPVVALVVRIVVAGETGGKQEARVEAILVVLHGMVFL